MTIHVGYRQLSINIRGIALIYPAFTHVTDLDESLTSTNVTLSGSEHHLVTISMAVRNINI